jgi:hypothetical protein
MSFNGYGDNPNWKPRQKPKQGPHLGKLIIVVVIAAALIAGVVFALNTFNNIQKQSEYDASLHVKGLEGKRRDAEFIRYLKHSNPVAFSGSSNMSLVQTGQEVRLALKQGISVNQITQTMLSSFFDPTATSQLLTASVKTYCPSYAGTISSTKK